MLESIAPDAIGHEGTRTEGSNTQRAELKDACVHFVSEMKTKRNRTYDRTHSRAAEYIAK